jgi:hypothetical protein
MLGASAALGHKLRSGITATPVRTEKVRTVIIGAGVSGLSAARQLHRQGHSDFILLDLEAEAGGNAAAGHNELSAYPLGAHYIPIPNNDLSEYLGFLQECGVLTGYTADGLPEYREEFLCFDPEERLYINGRWQEGLVPDYGLSPKDRSQVQRFLERMEGFRKAAGRDGKEAFTLPVDRSSKDEIYTALDGLTMKAWMEQEGFTAPALHWYVDYCTRDDYGTVHAEASAWAGIHYFASRKGRAANAGSDDVLTWPEGNQWLVRRLSEALPAGTVRNRSLAYRLVPGPVVTVDVWDDARKETYRIEAGGVVLALPLMAGSRLLQDPERIARVHREVRYAPWMVAGLRVKPLEERSGAPMSWDNVIYGSAGLGYVSARHQLLGQHAGPYNLSYYLPLTGLEPAQERTQALRRSHAEWSELILQDLQKVHPNIRSAIEEINIQVWGHAMAQPVPGRIHGPSRKALAQTSHPNLFYAHTDCAGISLFEEAFYQGIAAANGILNL